MSTNQSHVAKLREEIEATCVSMNLALNGFAQKAPHYVTTHQYATLDQQRTHLATLIGEEQALDAVCETYNTVLRKEQPGEVSHDQ